MASFGNVIAVVERPVGTTLQTAATAGDGVITVDDISKLTWPAGGLRIGTEHFIYEIDAAPDQSVNVIDQDEDDEGSDEVGTITLGGATLDASYDVDEPVLQFQDTLVTERLATVLLPDQAEELVLRVPRHLWDRLPSNIRERDAAPETVALENVQGEWVMTDVVSEDPSVDASFINIATLPQTVLLPAGTGADIATFFDEAWTAPGNVTANDGSYAHAIGTSATATVTPHSTGYKFSTQAADDSSTGSLEWDVPTGIFAFGGNAAAASGSAANTHKLQATDFGFAVPVGATITGVTVEITRSEGAFPGTFDAVVRLIKGGVISGTDNSSPTRWPESFGAATYGGDLWGLALTPADVNASDFGVNLQATLTTADAFAFVDAIRVKVNYTTTSLTEFRSNTHFIEASNFGFTIPDESLIVGITADVNRHASDDTGVDYATDNQVRITNGTDTSNDVAAGGRWPTSDGFVSYGGDLWGLTWTVDQINDSAFGFLISADVNFNVTAYINFIRVTVAYAASGDA